MSQKSKPNTLERRRLSWYGFVLKFRLVVFLWSLERVLCVRLSYFLDLFLGGGCWEANATLRRLWRTCWVFIEVSRKESSMSWAGPDDVLLSTSLASYLDSNFFPPIYLCVCVYEGWIWSQMQMGCSMIYNLHCVLYFYFLI